MRPMNVAIMHLIIDYYLLADSKNLVGLVLMKKYGN
jgi:hypothetical protein